MSKLLTIDRLRVANILSGVLHPRYAAVAVFAAVAYKDTGRLSEVLLWCSVLLLCVLLPVLSVIHIGTRQGHYADWTVPDRAERNMIYLVGLVGTGLFWLVSHWLGAPPTVMAVVLAMLISGGLAMVINFAWKISVHAGGIAGAACTMVFVYNPLAIPMLAAIPLVCWARVTLGRHTYAQVIAGAALAGVSTVTVLTALCG